MRRLIVSAFLIMLSAIPSFATYTLPSNDADCPANCRTIPWNAGSDQWNGGTLPTYTGVNCTAGLTEGDGTTNNATAIQTCINNLSSGQAAVLPAGIYYVNGTITIPSNKVLRGAGFNNVFLPTADASATTLKLGTSGAIVMGTGISKGTEKLLFGDHQKGTYTVTTSSAHGLVAGDWFVIYEHPDSAIPVLDAWGCSWCGESENSNHFISQFNKVVSVQSTTQFTSLRPHYYTWKSSLSAGLKKATFQTTNSGIEDIRVNGWSNSRTAAIISMAGTLYSWVKNVELYHDTNAAKGFPIYVEHSHGNEFRDSYIHDQRATSSDRAYGIGYMFTTSDNKIENCIVRQQRHGTAQEGGGAGNVWLYNYIDDITYEYYPAAQKGIKEHPQMNHGLHPIFTYWEGNIATSYSVEDVFGSSSHGVVFRNWLWGDLKGDFPGYSSTEPNYQFVAVKLDQKNVYYSLVGNVLGITTLHTTWSGGTLHPTNCNWFWSSSLSGRTSPVVYGTGCNEHDSAYSADSWNTSIKHGNYDYKTVGVAHWDGGADHTLANSLYYNSQPGAGTWWCTETTWPPIDPTGPTMSDIPAKRRYDGTTCTLGAATTTTPPPSIRFHVVPDDW